MLLSSTVDLAHARCHQPMCFDRHIRHQEFISAVTVQPPRAPLQLPFVTAERVKDVCDANHLACLMFRLAEAPPGMSVAHIMRDTDTEFLRDPANVSVKQGSYRSPHSTAITTTDQYLCMLRRHC